MWRRLVSWVAAYALVLHSVLVGIAGVPALAAGSDLAAGFELCQHSLDPADAGRGAPARHGSGDAHCKFCTAGGPSFVAPKVPSVSYAVIGTAKPLTPARANDVPSSPETFCEQPRGPPYRA